MKKENYKKVTLNLIQGLPRFPWTLSLQNSLRGRFQIKFGMTSLFNNNNAGFTLIELLVVVLIIGILAAVALPQYQKAVERSKATQALAIIRTVAAAQENYYLANGTYATNFNELAVDIPWTGTTRWIAGSSPADGVRSNEDWSVQIFHEASGDGISVGRLSGPYAGAGFRYLLDAPSRPTRTILCVENSYEGDGSVIFEKNLGDYCRKIMKGTYVSGRTWQISSLRQ